MSAMSRTVADPSTSPHDVADLRAFCLVADLGSITAAAKTLGETKGSVSRRLARLEQRLGVSLVRRSPRLVQPTDDGLAFRQRVGQALELLDDATAAVQHTNATPRGRLRVTAPADLAVRLIAPLLAQFSALYPEVQVEMLLTDKRLDFDAEQLDVAFRAAASLGDSALIVRKLLELESILVASPAYLEQHKPPREPDDLADHRMLLFRTSGGQSLTLSKVTDAKATTTVRVRADVLANDGEVLREVALAGGGIALLPKIFVDRELAQKRLLPLLRGYRADFAAALFLLHPPRQFLPAKVRAFRDFMVDALARR
jgi:DNA-binding transcriptional LysR family regulator